MRELGRRNFLCSIFLVSAFSVLIAGVSVGRGAQKANSSSKSADTNAKLDLNTASEKDLDNLPGVSSASAKKIIAGRPYSAVDDLSKTGLPVSAIKKITPLVTVGSVSAAVASTKSATAATAKPAKATVRNAQVNLNTGSETELDGLPGVGSATAKKIIAGRPYASVDDLSRAGVSASTIKKIFPLVVVSGGAANPAREGASNPASPSSPAAPSRPVPTSPARTTSSSIAEGIPGPGTVWVNLSSGVYHYSGSQFYGKTKTGKYMPEDDAVKAGYHAAKDEKKPQ